MADDKPITVYVVMDCAQYEGCRLHGVFSTREKAALWIVDTAYGGPNYRIYEQTIDVPDSQ